MTSGEGEVRVTPDRATISIGVQSRASTAAAAGADNARRQRAILDTLRSLGLSSDDLSTMNYNVSPEMQYAPNGTTAPKVVGYTVTNTVQAELKKLEDIGRVIDAVLAKGANEISSLQFRSTKADSARRAALALAVASARADAEALAHAAGGSVAGMIELSSTSYQMPRPFESAGRLAMAAKAPTPIEPGQQTVSASVTIRWVFLQLR
ncbi:MAG: SIMPL domain-containing protein [bacterium]